MYGANGSGFSGSISINLRCNTTYYIWFYPVAKQYCCSNWNTSYAPTITLNAPGAYNLSINAVAGVWISVFRRSSPTGHAIGEVLNGNTVYQNDSLQIYFNPYQNYEITSQTVNGSSFPYAGYHTVAGAVSVVATARALSSTVSATGATVGGVSTISINRNSTSYTHKLTYKYYSLSGTLTSNAGTSYAFSIPDTFYTQMPNSKYGSCTITCQTYSGSNPIGEAKTCSFYVEAAESNCRPLISDITATETNPLILDNFVSANNKDFFMAGLSSVKLKASMQARCSASINSLSIAGVSPEASAVPAGESSGSYYERVINNITSNSYVFSITDSRGYSTSTTKSINVYNYTYPTIKASVSRASSTSNVVYMNVDGSYYNGTIGPNGPTCTCKVEYRYAKKGENMGTWTALTATQCAISNGAFSTADAVQVPGNFAYTDDYQFEFRAISTANKINNSSVAVTLATAPTTVQLLHGVTSFDWGSTDFTFNIPVYSNQSIYMGGDDGSSGELNIKFKSVGAEGTPNVPVHDCHIYGGNPNSPAAIGVWDAKNGRRVAQYSDSSNNITLTDGGTVTICGGVDMGGDGNTEQRAIAFHGDSGSHPHHVSIYGGNAESTTALGVWDNRNERRVMVYADDGNAIYIGDGNTYININDTTLSDWPVEHGTSGDWGYVKWKSGFGRCWATFYVQSLAVTNAWGSVYTAGVFQTAALQARLKYPFAFIADPATTYSVMYSNANCWLATCNESRPSGWSSLTYADPVQVVRPTSTSGFDVVVAYEVTGRWK